MDSETKKHPTITGLPQNQEAALTYVLGWITGLIFLLLEKENKTIKFHALQSVVTFLGLQIISILAGSILFLGFFASAIIVPVALIVWIVLLYKAYNGEKYKLPIIGDFVERQLEKK